MRLENLAARLRKQSRVHVVQLSLLIIAMTVLLLWQTKFNGVSRPKWLLGFELHLSAVLVVTVLVRLCVSFHQGVTALRSDWLAVQPVALKQRMAWLRGKIAAQLTLELLVVSVLAVGLCGANYGVGVLVFGAGLGLITLILLPYWQTLAQTKNARRDLVIARTNEYHTRAGKANSATGRARAISADPFTTWFASAIPRLSRLRWWWLIPLLSLPMGSKIMATAAIFAGFLALSRFAAVCSAISIALANISKLTHTTALRPALLYRAALIFSAQGALILALLAIAIALSPAGIGGAIVVSGVGLLLLATALHFGFGYRLEPVAGSLRTRANLLIALLMGLTANSMPVLLPIVCTLLWFWLYRRGTRLDHTD